MIKRKPAFFLLMLFFIAPIMLGLGCGKNEKPEILMMGTNVWPGYEPLYLAKKLSYFKPNTVRLVEFTSASQVIKAFRNGSINAAALTFDEALLLVQHGVELKVVLVFDISHGGDVILGQPGLSHFSEIRGKRVGVENTALGAYTLTRALQIYGIKKESVNIISLEVDEHETAFKKGIIDAVVTFDPVYSKLMAAGARKLFDSSEIPNEIVDVLVVRAEYLEKYQENVKDILQSWFKALDYLQKEPQKAAELMAGRMKISPEALLDSYKGLKLPSYSENQQFLTGGKDSITTIGNRLAEVMVEEKLLERPVDLKSIIATRIWE